MLRQASLSHIIVFQKLASGMYLENCIQEIYDKKNIKTSEVIVITKVKIINLKIFERSNRNKSLITNACNAMQV